MNQLIPKYSFIKLFLPYAKNYNHNLFHNIDIGYSSYHDIIKIKNMEIETNISINNNIRTNYNIITSTIFVYDNKLIKEDIDIKSDKLTYQIRYKLNDELINIPQFKIIDDNYKLLLDNFKFMNDDYYKYYIELNR